MEANAYEQHCMEPDFPVIFHKDHVRKELPWVMPHWHENIELLYFVEGVGQVTSNVLRLEARPGDLVVINANHLHTVSSQTPEVWYYCLIIDDRFCSQFGLDTGENLLEPLVRDKEVVALYEQIVSEQEEKPPYYKASTQALAAQLTALLFRRYMAQPQPENTSAQNSKLRMVKQAILYFKNNLSHPLAIEDVINELGFTKYYFCHAFKEVTGTTAVSYFNLLRCQQARKLLSTSSCNVNQAAELCGFDNLSYFSKTYKKYMGMLPSETLKGAVHRNTGLFSGEE